jgi:hypothetical protein
MKSSERLDSWKEISVYVCRSVGTCMRWAKEFGLPIYHISEKTSRSRVFAFKSEIDQWFKEKPKIIIGKELLPPK